MNKGTLVQKAFQELGLSSVYFSFTEEQKQQAAFSMEAWLATQDSNGYSIGYPFELNNNSIDLQREYQVPLYAIEFIIAGAASALAPAYGIDISRQTSEKLSRSMYAIALRSKPPKRRGDGVPAGKGNYSWIPWGIGGSGSGNFLNDPNENRFKDQDGVPV